MERKRGRGKALDVSSALWFKAARGKSKMHNFLESDPLWPGRDTERLQAEGEHIYIVAKQNVIYCGWESL